jgi:ATP-dependent Clp protease ATP-binding subunit ClpB
LQVLDDGRLTDSKGRVVNFKNTIVIMTSNIGSQIILSNFEDLDHVDKKKFNEIIDATKIEVAEELKNHVRPEFLNRIDDVIMFTPFTKDEIVQILDLQLKGVRKMLRLQDLDLELDDAAKKLLADIGYEPQFGARPMKRVIQREIINPLAKEILSGKFPAGSVILATVDHKESLVFTLKEKV